MAQWGPFLAVVAVLTVLLLALSRQSQAFIRSNAGADGQSPTASETPSPEEQSPAASETPSPEGQSPTETRSGGDEPSGEAETQAAEVELTSTVLLANVASTQALFAGVVLVAAWYFSIPAAAFEVSGEPLSSGAPGVAVGLGFGLVLWLANELSTTVADAVGAAYDESVRGLLAPESSRGWVGLLVVVLPLIAVAEELLFRAALVGVPAAGFGVSPWLLAVVASLAFALGHGAQGRVGIVVTGMLGLVLAAGYILTESLLVVVVAHYVINAMEFLLHEFLGVETVLPSAAQPG